MARWIPLVVGLARKKKVLLLAERTGRSRYEVVGILSEFWGWASEESKNGVLREMTVDHLAQLFDIDRSFWDALIAIEWLEKREGSLYVPRFGRWLGAAAKARIKGTLRVQRWRRKRNASSVSKPLPDEMRGDDRREDDDVRCSSERSAREPPPVPVSLESLDLYRGDARLCKNWERLYASWTQAYPGVDLLAETRKAHAWELSNPTKRKLNRAAFLARWFAKVQDRGGPGVGQAAAAVKPGAPAVRSPSPFNDPHKWDGIHGD